MPGLAGGGFPLRSIRRSLPQQRNPWLGQSARLYDLIVNQGKLEEARALYRQILPLLRLTEETGELWQIVKYILKQRGFGTGTLRLPRQPISEGVKAQLDELLGKADFA